MVGDPRPPFSRLDDVFALYLPEALRPALATLRDAAMARALRWVRPPRMVSRLRDWRSSLASLPREHRVISVPHYSVGVETLHDLALGDDNTG